MIHNQICTFFLGDSCFGVDVSCVQEILRHQESTRVPLANGEVGGLINLRGQIVTAIELRARMKMPERDPEKRPTNVVIRTESGPVSLLVDSIGDVQELSDESLEATPETLTGRARELIEGVYKMNDRLILVLDVDKTIGFDASVV